MGFCLSSNYYFRIYLFIYFRIKLIKTEYKKAHNTDACGVHVQIQSPSFMLIKHGHCSSF